MHPLHEFIFHSHFIVGGDGVDVRHNSIHTHRTFTDRCRCNAIRVIVTVDESACYVGMRTSSAYNMRSTVRCVLQEPVWTDPTSCAQAFWCLPSFLSVLPSRFVVTQLLVHRLISFKFKTCAVVVRNKGCFRYHTYSVPRQVPLVSLRRYGTSTLPYCVSRDYTI